MRRALPALGNESTPQPRRNDEVLQTAPRIRVAARPRSRQAQSTVDERMSKVRGRRRGLLT
jgi:hypothetical protein